MSLQQSLSLDSSQDRASACLRLSNGQHRHAVSDASRPQAADLLQLGQGLLEGEGLSWGQLTGFVLCHGPGSFTGLRVAAGLVQGLARGLNLPVACVSGFEVRAYAAWRSAGQARPLRAVVDVDARLGEAYRAHARVNASGQVCLVGHPQVVPAVLPADWTAGSWGPEPDGSQAADQWLPPDFSPASRPADQQPGSATMAAWVLQAAMAKTDLVWQSAENVQPLYVRDKVAQTIAERQVSRATDLQALTVGDLASVLVIEQQAYPYPWSSGNFRDAMASGYPGLKLLDQGVMVGYLVWMRVLNEAHLLNFTIAPARQRRGLGQHLLTLWVERLRQEGLEQVLLEVRPSNDPAIRLYQRNGFVQTGRRRDYYPQGPSGREDAILMNKSLVVRS